MATTSLQTATRGLASRFALCWLTLWLGLCSFCSAQTIIIFGNSYSPPKIYLENGTPKGILPDILRYAERKLPNTRFDLRLAPWSRSYQMAQDGKGGIVGLSFNLERAKAFDYSSQVYLDKVVIVVRKGNEFPFSKIEDLQGKRLGVGISGSFGENFDRAKSKGVFQLDEDSSPVSRLKKLQAGHIDAALINPGRAGLMAAISQDPALTAIRSDFTVLPEPLTQDPNFLAFSKDMHMAEFLRQFNKVIEAGYANGDIPRMIRKYNQP